MTNVHDTLGSIYSDLGQWYADRFAACLAVFLTFYIMSVVSYAMLLFVLVRFCSHRDVVSGSSRLREAELHTLQSNASVYVLKKLHQRWRRGYRFLTVSGANMVAHLVSKTILVVGVVVTLQTAGLTLASMLTATAVVGFTISIALRDVLSNAFAGLQILWYNAVKTGDIVKISGMGPGVADKWLRVQSIGLTKIEMCHVPTNGQPDASGADSQTVFVVPPSLLSQQVIQVQSARASEATPQDGVRHRVTETPSAAAAPPSVSIVSTNAGPPTVSSRRMMLNV